MEKSIVLIERLKAIAAKMAASFGGTASRIGARLGLHPQKSPKKRRWGRFGLLAGLLIIIICIFFSLGGLQCFLPHSPALTGFPFGAKKYLIVFQNNTELRPSGGFLSAFGIADFQSGFFTGIKMEDVYGAIDEHPYIDPPYPMKELLADQWYKGYTFRDANYDADFPKTANELVRMMRLTRPDIKIDGVIAVNYSLLEDLLGVMGPVKVNGIEFTKDNLFETLEYEVNKIDRHNVEDLANRKNVLKPFANELIKNIILNPFRLGAICSAITDNLNKKNIQLYFVDDGLQDMSLQKGWAGAWPAVKTAGAPQVSAVVTETAGAQSGNDFFALVEANLGGMKSDRYIKRDVTYHVRIADDPQTGDTKVTAEVTVDIYHYGIDNIPLSGDYKAFFRVYAPSGAGLTDAAREYKSDLWQNDDGAHKVFGNVVRLKPGERTRLFYSYALPKSVAGKSGYSLNIPKQSGTNDYYSVIIEVPQGMGVTGSAQGSASYQTALQSKENFALFEGFPISDLNFNVSISPDTKPPTVIYQGTDDLNTISIIFNEKLSAEAAEDPLHYEIRDINAKHPEVTDNIYIEKIEYTGKGVRLHIKGMTNQPEEQYRVTLNNISDTAGNIIEPSPREITVVQRF